MSFSSEWLSLRESADQRARNRDVQNALAARFALRQDITVVDLGSGTGSNLRATAPLLPQRQHWTLVDHDAALLDSAAERLGAWADAAERQADGELKLRKDRNDITVAFRVADLAQGLEQQLGSAPDLITASALLDLVSPEFIKRLAREASKRRAAFYGALTYNGVTRWSPHRPTDNQIASAFHRHQMSDKGFGIAAGPVAATVLADELRLHDFTVLEGDSPWQLGRPDRMLIEELMRGHAMAVAETGLVDLKTIEAWVKVARSAAEIGHTDVLAVPV